MANKANILLVHGAWADGSSWSKIIPKLEDQGFNVIVAQLHLTSLAEDAETVRHLLKLNPSPTVLVGHSYGGAVITEAAADSADVVSLVYVAAFAPEAGESLTSIFARQAQPEGAKGIRPDDTGLLWLEKSLFNNFAQDCSDGEIRVMAVVQKPIAARCFEDKAEHIGWKNIPSWYQVSEDDRMIPPEAQRWMAKRLNATTISLPASHASLVSFPDEITNMIIEAAAKTTAVRPSQESSYRPSTSH